VTSVQSVRRSSRIIISIATFSALCGCDAFLDSSTSPNTPYDIQMSGSVGDGPIIDAELTVTSSTGEVLTNVVSDQTAGYNIQIKTQGKHYPLTVKASGGLDLVTNLPPDFELVSVLTDPSKKTVANLNPFSTLAVAVAKEMGGDLSANLVPAMAAVVTELNSGLDALAASGPMNTTVDDSTLPEIVNSAETLAETFRRTDDLVRASRGDSSIDAVIGVLASDLVDGTLDGRGAAHVDPFVSAAATIVAAQTALESMTNRLRVHGIQLDECPDCRAFGDGGHACAGAAWSRCGFGDCAVNGAG
jgi:hypothetical protein